MKISTKQIMMLMFYTNNQACRMVKEDAPFKEIMAIEKLILEISNQQSNTLIDVDDKYG